MSRPQQSISGSSSPFHRAYISWCSEKTSVKFSPVWFSISTCLRWKLIRSQNEPEPQLFSDFCGQYCLWLVRLEESAEWSDVVQVVYPQDGNGKPAFTVQGALSGPKRGVLSGKQNVQVVIASDHESTRNQWMDAVRTYISPWQLLHHRMEKLLLNSTLSKEAFESMFALKKYNTHTVNISVSDQNMASTAEPVELGENASEGLNILSGFVETVATLVKKSAPVLQETAEEVADFAKCVTIVSSAFQVVGLCARIVDMGMEMKRGVDAWPRIQAQVDELHQEIVKSMVPVLHPAGRVDTSLVKNVFQVQQELVDLLVIIEREMMRHGKRDSMVRFWKANELKRVEVAVAALTQKAVAVVQSGEISKNSRRIKEVFRIVNEIKSNAKSKVVPRMRQIPTLVPHFVGREKEIYSLKTTLDLYSSVAIMQFGGVGKTQLAVSFAEHAEKELWTPGGSFWIRAAGCESSLVSSIADFTEALTGQLFRDEDRNDKNIVVASFRCGLSSLTGKWLICFDNADDPSVNAVLGEVANTARLSDGWVIVTSRQGGDTMWEGMVQDQKLVLSPLDRTAAMIALYRYKENVLKFCVSDAEVYERIIELKNKNYAEYHALFNLAGHNSSYGLGGLPLALNQAGRFMFRRRVSCSKYVELYTKRRRSADVEQIFLGVKELGMEHEDQQTVWATWKINIEELSDTARSVIAAFAFFDSSPTPKVLVEQLDESFGRDSVAFMNIIHVELVEQASLIEERRKDDLVVFEMHRLLCDFVLCEKDDECREMICSGIERAINALHYCISSYLESIGESMTNPPCFCHKKLYIFLPHVQSLLKHYRKAVPEGQLPSHLRNMLLNLYLFLMRAQIYIGRTMELSDLCEPWYRLLVWVHGKNTSKLHISRALYEMGRVSNSNGFYTAALKYYDRSATMMKQIFGEYADHPEISATIIEMGRSAQSLGDFSCALRCYNQSYYMYRRMYGQYSDHPNISLALHHLGCLALDDGDYQVAQAWYNQALKMLKRILGDDMDHPDISAILHELGRVAHYQGDYNDAVNYYNQSLAMDLRFYGTRMDHPEVSATLHQLGLVAQETGEFDTALDWYHQSLSMKKRIHGEDTDHLEISNTLNELGRTLHQKGDFDAAISFYHESFYMYHRIYGQDVDHPDISMTLHDLGCLALEKRDYETAMVRCNQALHMLKRIYCEHPDHPDISAILHDLGRVAHNQDDYDRALKYYHQSRMMDERLYGNDFDDLEISVTLFQLGLLEYEKGDYDASLKWYHQALEMYKRIHYEDVNHPDISNTLKAIGDVEYEQGNYLAAASWYNQSFPTSKVMNTENINQHLPPYREQKLPMHPQRESQIQQKPTKPRKLFSDKRTCQIPKLDLPIPRHRGPRGRYRIRSENRQMKTT